MRGFLKATAAVVLAAFSLTEAHSLQRNPLHHISRVEAPIIHTPANRVHSHTAFDITFHIDNSQRQIRLSLQPNHDVLGNEATVHYIDNDGNIHRQERLRKEDHRLFKGSAFIQHPGHPDWINSGWARVTVIRDGENPLFEGSFQINGEAYRIKTSANFRETQHPDDPSVQEEANEYLVVWKDTDIKGFFTSDELKRSLHGADASCSSDNLGFNLDARHPIFSGLDARSMTAGVSPKSLFGRDIDGLTGDNGAGVNLASTIGSTAGCPSTRKVALVGIAVDCNYRASFKTESEMRTNILGMVSQASQLYEDMLNISLGVANLTIVEAECPGTPPASTPWNVPCSSTTTITNRLNLFSAWRGQFTDSNAYWTLLTKCPTDGAVGLAWLGQLCKQGSQAQGGDNGADKETIAAANVVVRTDQEWEVFAHESGHTFGAVHDCTSSTCSDGSSTKQQCCPLSSGSCDAGGKFIMNPSTSSTITRFSACTIGNICTGLLRTSVDGRCLTDNRNVPTITEAQCGNGIVEPGEDCDCGGATGCAKNNCCDATTCKYKGSAKCDPTNEDCCTDQCQFAAKGFTCRASTGTCDPAETCPGTSAHCPEDTKAPDGDSCGANGAGLTCASGQCTSRDQQCRTMVGAMLTNNETYACDSQGCRVSCSSPSLGSNTFGQKTCVVMQQNFLDGTPCQGGGKCSNGQCQGSNAFNSFVQLINDNKSIAIPIICVVGGLILISLLSCCWSACARRSRRRKMKKAAAAGPPMRQQNWNPNAGGPNMPMAPPPAYAEHQSRSGRRSSRQSPQWQGGGPPPMRVPTTRYA